jgi:thymidylate kinase
MESGGLLIHINGWPGCGKWTIARVLARRLGGKLVDNHVMLNPAEALFDRADPLYWSLRKAVRAAVLDHAARLDPKIPLIFTDALADDATDRAVFEQYRDLAVQRGARLASVMLDCEPDENIRRLTRAGRAELHKLTRPEVLAQLRADYRLLRPDDVPIIEIDVTRLSPDAAAGAIEAALPARG